MLQQRLRWSQGTLQVMLRENPLVQRGLSLGQRLMYFGTMWSYLSGFTTLVYLAAPIGYRTFGIRPVETFGQDFLFRLLPFLVVNQLLGLVGRGFADVARPAARPGLVPPAMGACVTAVGNVWFGRSLGFVVTPKTRQESVRPQWTLVRPQIAAMGLLWWLPSSASRGSSRALPDARGHPGQPGVGRLRPADAQRRRPGRAVLTLPTRRTRPCTSSTLTGLRIVAWSSWWTPG